MNKRHKQFQAVDLMRLFMSVNVVAIHTQALDCIDSEFVRQCLNSFCRLAVPFFFVASGFFVWRNISDGSQCEKLERIQDWLKYITKLYIVWSVIYLPFAVYGFAQETVGFGSAILIYFRNFLLVGENFWSWPLWYLLAIIVAGCIIWIIIKFHGNIAPLYPIAIVLALTGLCMSECQNEPIVSFYYKLFKTARNGVFVGLPYLTIGILIANGGLAKMKYVFPLIGISLVAYILEVPFMGYVVIWALFSLLIQIERVPYNVNYYLIRVASEVIYLVHMLWYGFFSIICPKMSSVVIFFSVVLLSSMTALIVIKNRDKKVVRAFL